MLLSRAYGAANLDWNVPNTPDAKFRLGSVTKQLAPDMLARYVGTYELTSTVNLTVTLADGRLVAQLTGQRGQCW